MKILIAILFSFFSSGDLFAATVGFYPSGKKGIILIENSGTPDADFFWSEFAVEATISGLDELKSFETQNGDFKAKCKRAHVVRGPVTSCTITLEGKIPGGVVSAKKDEKTISGLYPEYLRDAFRLTDDRPFISSPDGKLKICSVCGVGGGGIPYSVVWSEK